jgi:hypothetical protein
MSCYARWRTRLDETEPIDSAGFRVDFLLTSEFMSRNAGN